MSFCCNGLALGNTGLPNSVKVFDRGNRHWLVPLFKKDGSRNQILDTDNLDQSYFQNLIEAAEPEDRWYPLVPLQDVTAERADPTTQAFNSGNSAVTQQGVRTYDVYAQAAPASYKEQLDKWGCNRKFGMIVIDNCGRPGGVLCKGAGAGGEDAIRPMPIFGKSWNPQVVFKTQDNVGGVRIRFEFDQRMNDGSLRVVDVANEAAAQYLLYDAEGLVSARAKVATSTATNTAFSLTLDSDGSFEPPAVTGWVVADFSIQNQTTNASVTIDSVTEAPEGTYDLAHAAGVTAGDTLLITGVKAGVEVRFTTTAS